MRLAGAGTSALVLPGIAAANGDSENKRQKGGGQSASRKSRAEKAAEEDKKWDENWINQDRIGENWVDVETADTDTLITTQIEERDIGGTVGAGGITVTIDGYLGDCDGWVEFGALGQSHRFELSCSNACNSFRRDAGGAFIENDFCVNWDELTLSVDIEGCVWHLTDWTCGSVEETL